MLRCMFSSLASGHAVKVMAKGLPKKLPVVGVDNIVMVSSTKGGVGPFTKFYVTLFQESPQLQ